MTIYNQGLYTIKNYIQSRTIYNQELYTIKNYIQSRTKSRLYTIKNYIQSRTKSRTIYNQELNQQLYINSNGLYNYYKKKINFYNL
jgi:hypothetical protein